MWIGNKKITMKKILLLITVLLPTIAFAKTVTVERAQKIAETFVNRQADSRSVSAEVSLVWNGETNDSRTSNHAPAYYVFENSVGGFVIVAGDDVVNPILGYSNEGNFNVDNMPENLKYWMNELRGGINYLRENNAQPDNETRAAWDDINSGKPASRAVEREVLLETAKWNQTTPFNNMCPTIEGKKTYVGCVPTAMAIMMRYYQWPQAGVGYLEGYDYEDEQGYVRFVDGYPLGHEYDWDNMPLDFSNYTQTQADAVAQLMKDCSVAAQAKFDVVGSGGTGAYEKHAMLALIKHMSYDAGAFYYEKEMFTNLQWRKMLYQSISSNNPVWYSGNSASSGHSFILDGYDSNGNFHVNWGWGGQYNGYFDFPNFREYDVDHEAVMGLKKNEGGESLEIMILDDGYDCSGIKLVHGNYSNVERGVPFEIELGRLSNGGIDIFNGEVSIAVVNRNDEIKETLQTIEIYDLNPGYGWPDLRRTCTITKDIEIGDCIKLFYKSIKSDEWKPVWYVKEAGFVGELPIADQYYIEEVTSFEYKVEEKLIEINTKPDASWKLTNQSGTLITNGTLFEEGTLTIDTTVLDAGSYSLVLSKGKDSKELNFILGGK